MEGPLSMKMEKPGVSVSRTVQRSY